MIVFKLIEDEVIALWPDISWDTRGKYITSYMHCGQHSAAHPDLLTDLPDAPEELVAPLKAELISIGYEL